MARIGLIITVVASLQLAACGASAVTCPNTIQVSLLSNASLLLDGSPTTIEGLEKRLTELDATNGKVWYYRQDSHKAPSEAVNDLMMKVLEMFVKHKRPVSFSSRADFGDTIDTEGNTAPRTKCEGG